MVGALLVELNEMSAVQREEGSFFVVRNCKYCVVCQRLLASVFIHGQDVKIPALLNFYTTVMIVSRALHSKNHDLQAEISDCINFLLHLLRLVCRVNSQNERACEG